MHDLVIRNGLVYDGLGGKPYEADIAINGATISIVGTVTDSGREEIDATGQIVTPGFVDAHTHYDGQVTWDPYLQPSTFHGVTTAIMGNCGVGFAPCAPDRHTWLIGLMEGVEDIPGTALAEGIKWGWESFPDYMDVVEKSPLAIDVGLQVPHGALRAYVMGERGARLEPATREDTDKMAALVEDALAAGALGVSTSRTEKHRDKDGEHTPTYKAEEMELNGIAEAMKRSGKGVIQLIADFRDVDWEFGMLRRMVEISGRPLSLTIEQDDRHPDIWSKVLDKIADANAAGLPMRGQVPARPTGVVMGLTASLNPFLLYKTWHEIMPRTLKAQVDALKDADFRARLLAEDVAFKEGEISTQLFTWFHKMFPLGSPPNYEPAPEDSVEAQAKREGRDPREVLLDWMAEDDGKALIYFPLMNYLPGDLSYVEQMLKHPNTTFGLSDGGAHVGIICDASFPTTMLTHWGRDRTRGDKLPLEWIISGQTKKTAELVGLYDRGVLAPGMKADVNVIDFENLTMDKPEIVYDLPAGGKRFVQKTRGYTASIISGAVAFRDGEPTGVLGGKLIRGSQARPAAAQIPTAAE